MIKLNKLLILQLVYVLLGVLFNLVSYYLILENHKALTPTQPLLGILAMLVYMSFLLTGFYKKIVWYRVLMTVSILIFGYTGIIKHIITFSQEPDLYYSFYAVLLAVGINLFGFLLNLIAVFKKFKT